MHYGIWRPYKYVAILMWRQLYPMFNCLLKIYLKVGDEVLCYR